MRRLSNKQWEMLEAAADKDGGEIEVTKENKEMVFCLWDEGLVTKPAGTFAYLTSGARSMVEARRRRASDKNAVMNTVAAFLEARDIIRGLLSLTEAPMSETELADLKRRARVWNEKFVGGSPPCP